MTFSVTYFISDNGALNSVKLLWAICVYFGRGGPSWLTRCVFPDTHREVSEAAPDNAKYSRKDEQFYIITKKKHLREGQRCHLGKFTLTFSDILQLFQMPANAYAGVWKLIKKKLMKYANAADWAWILEGKIFSVYICCVLMNSEFQPSVLANTWCSWTAKWFQTSERPNVYV